MFLLSPLALTVPIDDIRYECSVKRSDPLRGTFDVSAVIPETGKPEFVSHAWRYTSGSISTEMDWTGPAPAAPADIDTFKLQINGIAKGSDEVRVELWREGKRVTEVTGGWESMRGRGYRRIFFAIAYGTMRALGRGGPILAVVVDREGEVLAKGPLPVEVIEAPATFAASAQDDYVELAAHAATRCPEYQPPTIIVT